MIKLKNFLLISLIFFQTVFSKLLIIDENMYITLLNICWISFFRFKWTHIWKIPCVLFVTYSRVRTSAKRLRALGITYFCLCYRFKFLKLFLMFFRYFCRSCWQWQHPRDCHKPLTRSKSSVPINGHHFNQKIKSQQFPILPVSMQSSPVSMNNNSLILCSHGGSDCVKYKLLNAFSNKAQDM